MIKKDQTRVWCGTLMCWGSNLESAAGEGHSWEGLCLWWDANDENETGGQNLWGKRKSVCKNPEVNSLASWQNWEGSDQMRGGCGDRIRPRRDSQSEEGWQGIAAWRYRAEDRPGKNPVFCLCKACGAMLPCGLQSICWEEPAPAWTSQSLTLLPAPRPSYFQWALSIFITPSLKQTPRKQLCEVPCRSIFPLQAAAAWWDYLFFGSQAYKVAFLSQFCFKSFKVGADQWKVIFAVFVV